MIVSATVVLAVLYWWDGRNPTTEPTTRFLTPTIPVTVPAVVTTAEAVLAAATDTPAPEETEFIHVVQPGDTLGSISEFYDVPLNDIMIVNGLDNANFISVGQQLTIPIGGIPTPTPEPTATATPQILPSPIPTEPIDEGEVIIVIADIIGVQQLTEEAVQIVNNGSRQVSLAGWELADGEGNVYTFGQVILFGDGAGILVHTETGEDIFTDLYWGLETPIWTPGEQATLTDAEGTEQATFVVP